MIDSEKAAPNDRDKSRYGENRQVRASADARKWKRMIEYAALSQVGLICVAVAALIVDTIRAPDMSAGFGIHSLTTQRMLYQQFGASTLPAVVLILLATAKSLSVQLGRPLPKVFPRLMWTFVVINQLFVLPSMVRTSRRDTG